MAWTTLTNESKKLAWWLEYLFRAAPRFWLYTLRDKIGSNAKVSGRRVACPL